MQDIADFYNRPIFNIITRGLPRLIIRRVPRLSLGGTQTYHQEGVPRLFQWMGFELFQVDLQKVFRVVCLDGPDGFGLQ